ncbi:protein ALTERED PHOSPHATE STARVATION RESPONSE 1-like [Humulus lupulus]|uniref:protein ALTERED PHOSPHATE STARVATION RESPONSE 1-like n=1 Tax=Humulus lupulus TaxID=3486 RepID=UPI002B403529|nr:protein ALTERED PHOSPHATE STARVATION RESPONSE 1-like [Humulus lupulus]XP_062102114.1 protein ALTERED PHOSPHATE STARVATION RESPONSE 1-like [Humulus lupulus]
MGCANSKLNDLPAVALCRDRCRFLDEALRHSHDFAEAHAAYLESLKALGPAFDRFFSQNVVNSEALKKCSSLSPAAAASSSPVHKSNPDSNSDSHLRFPSDSSEDEDTDNKLGHNYISEEETQGLIISHNFNYLNSKPPPSPPPASLGSAWDFLNLFENFEKYERLYTSNPERSEATEKVQGSSKPSGEQAENGETTAYEVRVLEKKSGETKKESSEKTNDSVTTKTPNSSVVVLGVPEAMDEIKLQFVQASESGNEVLKLLHHRLRVPLNQDSFRLVFEEDMGVISSPNLSSTLKKLLLWEKKLYLEVKAEEKLRTIYQKKYQQLKILDREGGGGKALKANSTKALLRDLSTKLKIAFQIVDRISIAINKLRNEELWPQIKELNNRLLPMWKAMIECHKRQYQAISEVKSLDANAITSNEKLNNADLEAAIQLKLVLQSWNLSFSNWIFSQKDYIKSMNGWLMRCLLYEPEETSDGQIPFSPGRLGAPNIFVICNHWSQALDRISEKEVIGAIQGCLACIDTQLKEHNVELLKMVISDKEIERKVKILEREEQKMVKLIQGREKNMVTGFVLSHSDIIKCSDLQLGLKQIFMAMEKFIANSIQVYEELRVRIEEVGEYNAAENLSGS